MTPEFELTVLGASLGLSALAGYITERVKLGPLVGAMLVGLLVRIIAPHIGVDLENEAWTLLFLAAMFVIFESGREVGEVGFESRLVYTVLVEIASIVGITFLLTAPFGFEIWERIAIALTLFSSSTTTVYLFAKNLRLIEAKSIALSWTVLEDLALIVALSMTVGYPETNPLVLLVMSSALAILASITIGILFNYIPPRGPYGVALSISLMISYGMIAGYFASPYLGVFIVGYIFAKYARKESLEQFSDLAIILYGLTVGLLTPIETIPSSPHILTLIMLMTVFALIVRTTAVFLASLLLLRSPFYSTILALSMQNISELSPLVVLTLEKAGLIKSELASIMVLLPVLTIAFSNATSSYWTRIASIINKHIAIDISLWIPQGFYEIGVKLLITTGKITMVFLSIFVVYVLLDRLQVSHLVLAPVFVVGGLLVARLLKELSWELKYVHGLPVVIAETLTVLATGSLTIYVTAEIVSKYMEMKLSSLLALLAVLLVIGAIIEVLIVIRRVLKRTSMSI
ncbi:MAG: cation:proton antiporter [Acidilobaceae archaeon]